MTDEEFFENIEQWIKSEKENWNHITYLAYFCYKYEKINGVRFRLVRSMKGPTLGKEAADFAKLFKILAPVNYQSLSAIEKKNIRTQLNWKIYNYINWVFDYKFRMKMGSVNGTRLFHTPSLIVEFERMYAKHQLKKESKDKILIFLDWCKKEIPDILELHQLNEEKDIKMLVAYAQSYNLDSSTHEYKAIQKAKEIGIL